MVLTIGTLRSTLMIDIFTAIIGIELFSCVRLPERKKKEVPFCAFRQAIFQGCLSAGCTEILIGI